MSQQIKPDKIVGMIQDRQGRTLVAGHNGIFELRSTMKGDELVPVAVVDDLPRPLAEAVAHEQQVNDDVKRVVEASRQQERTDGNLPNDQQANDQASNEEGRQALANEPVESSLAAEGSEEASRP